MMIKPIHNREAINILSAKFYFPPMRFKRRSLLARECNALIQLTGIYLRRIRGKHES